MDKDKFTLEEIEAAVRTTRGRWFETGEDIEGAVKTILAELTRPKHSFREGEVVFIGDRYMLYGRQDYAETSKQPWKPARPLTLSEMPKAVEDLRDYVFQVSVECSDKGESAVAASVLDAFDEVIKP